jgi:hypothetical protein
MTLQQARRGMQQERKEHAAGCGESQGALEGAPGGGLIAERVTGDRLQQQARRYPARMAPDGAVNDGRERGRRRQRILLGQPQRRQDGAHLCAFALTGVQAGQGGFDAVGSAQPH